MNHISAIKMQNEVNLSECFRLTEKQTAFLFVFPMIIRSLAVMKPLDRDDCLILHLLQQDARLNNKEIAGKIGKSASRVYERIKRLEDDGYIKRYVAILDKAKIDQALTAYTHVQLKEHAAAMMEKFEREVIQFSEVMECYHMTGQYDYLLKVALKDMDAYHGFMLNKLARLANVGTVQSFFVMKEAKKETAYTITAPSVH